MRKLLKLDFVWLIFAVLVFIACKEKKTTAAPPEPFVYPDSIKLAIANQSVTLEVVTSEDDITRGLMFREQLDRNSGMLFVFPFEGRYSFWMKNTPIPLSIAFLNSSGVIVGLDEMVPFDTVTRHQPVYPFTYAIEMNSGWFSTNGVKQGDTIRLPWFRS